MASEVSARRRAVRPTRTRLKDVAEAAGVHPSTASRALNDLTAGMVQQDTQDRVRRIASEMGYRVNGMARALKTRRSRTIGLIVPDITNPFFPPAVRGAEERFAASGYSLLLSSSNNDTNRALNQLDAMLEAQVDGLLLAQVQRRDPIVDRLAREGVPVVLFNRTVDKSPFSTVLPDDAAGAKAAVEHLHALGHRSIGLVVGPLFTSTGDRRLRAFKLAAKRLGLTTHTVEASAFDEASGYRAGQQLLREFPQATGVVAGNDLLAIGCIDAALAAGLRCPRDISIVGFNDMPLASRIQPPLTTVMVPELELGQMAAELLLRQIDDPGAPAEHQLLGVTLVVRGSTASPR